MRRAVFFCNLLVLFMTGVFLGLLESRNQQYRMATFGMPGAVILDVVADPSRGFPEPQQVREALDRAAGVLGRAECTVVLDGVGNEGPRHGLHDSAGFLTHELTSGSGLNTEDFRGRTRRMMLNAGSFVGERPELYFDPSWQAVGWFRPVGGDRFVTSWYVLFSDEAFLGTYYVRAGDESQARDLAEALGAIAEVTVRQSPASALGYISLSPATLSLLVAVLAGVASWLVIVATLVRSGQRRVAIQRVCGASRARAWWDQCLAAAGWALLGGVAGAIAGWLGVVVWLPGATEFPVPLAWLGAAVAGVAAASLAMLWAVGVALTPLRLVRP